jgi:hypothetical protein
VNPYHPIEGTLHETTIRTYHTRAGFQLAPHLFALTEDAYSTMVKERHNQCVIISGEVERGEERGCWREYVCGLIDTLWSSSSLVLAKPRQPS